MVVHWSDICYTTRRQTAHNVLLAYKSAPCSSNVSQMINMFLYWSIISERIHMFLCSCPGCSLNAGLMNGWVRLTMQLHSEADHQSPQFSLGFPQKGKWNLFLPSSCYLFAIELKIWVDHNLIFLSQKKCNHSLFTRFSSNQKYRDSVLQSHCTLCVYSYLLLV